MNTVDWDERPAARPLRRLAATAVQAALRDALGAGDGLRGAHCIHELWMREDVLADIGALLEALWRSAAASVPDWLPMTWFDALPRLYEVTARFERPARGRSNLYLVLLDYHEQRDAAWGFYVGMTRHRPSFRFDQHKAGIRAAGSVLRRGVELLTGPVMHLQGITHAAATDIEMRLAEVLRAEGLRVQGGH